MGTDLGAGAGTLLPLPELCRHRQFTGVQHHLQAALRNAWAELVRVSWGACMQASDGFEQGGVTLEP